VKAGRGYITSLNIIVMIMIGMIFAALIAHHFSDRAKGKGTTDTNHATATIPLSR